MCCIVSKTKNITLLWQYLAWLTVFPMRATGFWEISSQTVGIRAGLSYANLSVDTILLLPLLRFRSVCVGSTVSSLTSHLPSLQFVSLFCSRAVCKFVSVKLIRSRFRRVEICLRICYYALHYSFFYLDFSENFHNAKQLKMSTRF